jgi:isocitrate dehydrogenase
MAAGKMTADLYSQTEHAQLLTTTQFTEEMIEQISHSIG